MTTPNIRELRRQRARHSTSGPVWLKLLVVFAGLYVIYVLAGFFVAPSVLKTQIERRLSAQLKREVHVDRAAFNPFALSVRVDNLVVRDHGGASLVGWGRLFLNFEVFSLFADEIHFSEIELDGFVSRLAVSKTGILNVADIELPGAGASATSGKSWTLRIDRLAVNRAEIDYSDESRADPFTTHVGPTTFVLHEFRTSGGPGAPGVFKATTEAGESISWTGRLALAPLRSNGEVRIGQLALKKYAPFYSRLVQFDVTGGAADIQAPYEFSIQNNKPQIKVTEATVQIQDLTLVERGGKDPVVGLKALEVTRASFDLQANSTEIRQVSLSGGRVTMRRDSKGLNLASLFVPKPQAQTAAVPAARERPLGGTIAEIAAKDLTLSFEDKTTPRPAAIELSRASFSLKHLSLGDLGTLVPLDFRGELSPGGGTIHVEGQVSAKPLKADGSFTLEGVSLAALSPWVETWADVRLVQGIVGARGKLRVIEGTASAPVLTATLDADVGLLSATDPIGGELLRWKALAVRGAEYGSAPARLTVTEITLADPEVKLAMNKDHALNVSAVLRPSPPIVSVPGANASAPAMFIALDRVALANASVRFTDDSIEPAVSTSLEQLSGTMTGMTSAVIDRGDLVFNGRIGGAAPFSVTGKANLLSTQPAVDLKMELKNSDLLPLGSYIGRFVGYELTSGALSLDTRAKVVNRKLDSTSNVTVTNFTLGNATNSPDAPHVPVHLALALLRDAEGKIVLSLPVQGSLDDPSFQIGGVVMQVIRSLITKAATSPFTLIGAMFGGGSRSSEDLSFQEFTPGSAELAANATGKLDVVARALRERPALRLAVMGNTDPAADLAALKEQELEHRIRTSIWEDVRKVDPTIDTPDKITVSVGAANRVIGLLYQDAFMHSMPEAPSVPSATPTEAPRKRMFLFRWFTRNKPEPAPTPTPPPALRPGPSPAVGTGLAAAAAPTPVVLPSVDEMRRRLLDAVPVGDQELQKLSLDRANEVRKYMMSRGQVSPDRIEVVAREGALKPSRRVILQLQ